jgi:hypothetical protein
MIGRREAASPPGRAPADALTRLLVSARICPCSESPARAVRDACDVTMEGGVWRESWAADAFLVGGREAPVVLAHDGPKLGYVTITFARDGWRYAELALEVNAEQRALIRHGGGVSIDARSLRRDDDSDLYIRRHRMAKLDAVAICANGERPIYPEAKIVSIDELRERRAAKVAASLDPDFAGVELTEGCVLIDHVKGVSHRYERGRLVRV